jgi:DNA repair protein RadC
MWYITHFITVAKADDVGEIVLDYSEMIAVIVDVGWKEERVAPSSDELLTEVRGLPVHF